MQTAGLGPCPSRLNPGPSCPKRRSLCQLGKSKSVCLMRAQGRCPRPPSPSRFQYPVSRSPPPKVLVSLTPPEWELGAEDYKNLKGPPRVKSVKVGRLMAPAKTRISSHVTEIEGRGSQAAGRRDRPRFSRARDVIQGSCGGVVDGPTDHESLPEVGIGPSERPKGPSHAY